MLSWRSISVRAVAGRVVWMAEPDGLPDAGSRPKFRHHLNQRNVSVTGWMWLLRPLRMTRIGTNPTRHPAARKAINVSDSTSKRSVLRGRAAQVPR